MAWKTYLYLMHTEAYVMCFHMYVVEGNQQMSLKYLWFDRIRKRRSVAPFRCFVVHAMNVLQ